MTAEWLPRYLLWSNIITINDSNVIEECDKKRQSWDSWIGYLFKTYKNDVDKKTDSVTQITDLNVKSLRAFMKNQNYDYLKIMREVKGKNIKLDSFLSNLVQLGLSKPGLQFPTAIYRLPVTNPIRIICRAYFTNADNLAFEKILKSNFKGTTPTEFVLKMFGYVKTEILVNLFDLPAEDKIRTAKSDDDVELKIQNRRIVFDALISEGKILVPDKDEFLDLIALHIHVVEFYRNRMNHGVIEFKGIEGNENIIGKVGEILSLIKAIKNETMFIENNSVNR